MHYFYSPDIFQPFVTLSNEESEHCVRVMRHREGDEVRVTDGCGHLADAVIAEAHPKKCLLQILQQFTDNLLTHNGLHLAIAPTKNADRMEWLLEKAIEIGICSLTFLQCDHSERTHLNLSTFAIVTDSGNRSFCVYTSEPTKPFRPTPATDNNGTPFRTRASPLGLKGLVGMWKTIRGFARRRCAGISENDVEFDFARRPDGLRQHARTRLCYRARQT